MRSLSGLAAASCLPKSAPDGDVPNCRHDQRDPAAIDHLPGGEAVNDDDATGERHRTRNTQEQRTGPSRSTKSSPESPERDRQRSEHERPQDGIAAKEAQADCRERRENQRSPRTTERGDKRTDDACAIGDAHAKGRIDQAE